MGKTQISRTVTVSQVSSLPSKLATGVLFQLAAGHRSLVLNFDNECPSLTREPSVSLFLGPLGPESGRLSAVCTKANPWRRGTVYFRSRHLIGAQSDENPVFSTLLRSKQQTVRIPYARTSPAVGWECARGHPYPKFAFIIAIHTGRKLTVFHVSFLLVPLRRVWHTRQQPSGRPRLACQRNSPHIGANHDGLDSSALSSRGWDRYRLLANLYRPPPQNRGPKPSYGAPKAPARARPCAPLAGGGKGGTASPTKHANPI
ncbi:hypothetical protein LZ31DRAFT_24755 [Colletotrichum somersetense]|nr:hypothetical protein LZ31DRAFT_24755 [Colletotrichum somersetense]